MPRLFVAIDLPLETKAELGSRCSGIIGARWVVSENMHLTLRFIGEADAARLEEIKIKLGAVSTAPFTFHLRGFGQFPPVGNPRIIWAGVSAPSDLWTLQHLIDITVQRVGFGPANKPFSAHITLARLKHTPTIKEDNLQRFFDSHKAFESTPIAVDHFTLYSSITGSGYPHYQCEAAYPLTEN